MKKTGNEKKMKFILIILFAAALCLNLSAMNLFAGGGKKGVRKGKRKPTEITSNTLNADMLKNTIIFTGDVFVDDDQMTINCHKMTIFLEEKEQKITEDTNVKKKSEDEQIKGKKEPTKVLCEGDVVIVRKVYGSDEKEKGAQKAKADRAMYDLKIGKIELTGSRPQITRGEDLVIADKIIIWRDKEAADCIGNVKTMISGALEEDNEKTEKEKKVEEKTEEEEAAKNRMSEEDKKKLELDKLREKKAKQRIERPSESSTVEAIMNGEKKNEKNNKKEKSIEDLIKDEVTDEKK